MDREIVDAITAWETTGLTDGYAGLNDLAARSFSGAVTAGGVWAFMLNGRVIGLVDGSLAAFEGSETTAYEAPDPALPLLYTMQSSDCEKEAAYYTNRTPISEVDATLSSGGFTGYIELAENVHSGDYYVVYYGGKSMSVAFVGNQRRLLTDEEAFERANDEVGIYDVYAADIEVTPIPEAESPPPAASTESAPDATADEMGQAGSTAADLDGDDPIAESGTDQSESTAEGPVAGDDDAAEPEAADAAEPDSTDDEDIILGIPDTSPESDESEQADHSVEAASADTEAGDDAAGTETEAASTDTEDEVGSAERGVEPWGEPTDSTDEAADGEPVDADTVDDGTGEDDTAEDNEVGGDTVDDGTDADETDSDAPAAADTDDGAAASDTDDEIDSDAAEAPVGPADDAGDRAAAESAADDESIASLRSELEAAKAEIRRLRQQSTAAAESTTESARTMGIEEALAGTKLFVRYDSRGQPTLETVDDPETTADAVNDNLRIDPHTTFDSEAVTIEDRPFAAFLADRIEVDFLDWLVRKLPYEIRDTRNQRNLGGIYDAIPAIDRAELRGAVDVGGEEGEEPQRQSYDVVVRNKMGEPLFVVVIEDSTRPVGGELIERLIREGNDLAKWADTFEGVFAVTTSYYGPDALEAVSDATGGGILSRNKKKGFVSVSRKRGFHVCLTDYLNGEFDLRVPEL